MNNHTRMLLKALNAGESQGHLKRISNSKITNSETVASKYFLYKNCKERKDGGQWWPDIAVIHWPQLSSIRRS